MHSEYWEEQALMYITQDLDANQRRQFEEHLKTCKQCQDDVGEWQTIAGASEDHFRSAPVFRQRQWTKVLPFAAVVIMIVALGLMLASGGLDPKEPNSGAAPNLQATDVPTVIPTELPPPTVPVTPSPIPSELPTSVPTVTVTATPAFSPTATFFPTATPIPTNSGSADGASTDIVIGFPPTSMLEVSRINFVNQGFNHQGPATLGMGLSFYGSDWSLDPIAAEIHPDPSEPNVSPHELVDFTNTQVDEADAVMRINGSVELVKLLVSAGYPVIIEMGLDVEDQGWFGHYRLVVGYDEQNMVLYDPYFGSPNQPSVSMTSERFMEDWWEFSNTFIVLYPPDEWEIIRSLLGRFADESYSYERLITDSQAAVFDDNMWAVFNVGDAFAQMGEYEIAAGYFKTVLAEGNLPQRLLVYRHTPMEAYYQIGDFEALDALLTEYSENNPAIEELFYYRGLMYADQGETDLAIEAFTSALGINPNYQAAQDALDELVGN